MAVKNKEGSAMADMSYKRLCYKDRFERDYYCKHGELGQLRIDKKRGKKAVRAANRKAINEYLGEEI